MTSEGLIFHTATSFVVHLAETLHYIFRKASSRFYVHCLNNEGHQKLIAIILSRLRHFADFFPFSLFTRMQPMATQSPRRKPFSLRLTFMAKDKVQKATKNNKTRKLKVCYTIVCIFCFELLHNEILRRIKKIVFFRRSGTLKSVITSERAQRVSEVFSI